jgi:hypothetical protein
MGEFSPKGISPAAPYPWKKAWEFFLYPTVPGKMSGELFRVGGRILGVSGNCWGVVELGGN